MLSGQNPFRKDTPIETAAAILHLTPPPLSIDPSGPGQSISGALDRMLAKKPSARCHSMSEVRALLREVDRRQDQFAPLRPNLQPESQAAGGKAALWRSRKLLPKRVLGLLVGLIAATAVWALWWFATPATARLPARTIPLTSDGQWKYAPALSPDGKLVAFSWNGPSATNFDLYVKPTEPDTAILRLTSDPAFDSEGSWSPDGKRLAFIRLNGARATIYTIPSLGGQEKKIIDVEGLVPNVLEPDNDAPAWSPAGNWLAYAAKPSEEEPFQILLVDPQTREKQVLTTPPAGSRGDLNPSFSPDGRQVAFVRGSGSKHSGLDIWIQDLGGQPPRQLTSQGYELCYGLSWMPGGKELLFTAGFLFGQRLFRMDLAEGVPRPLTGLGEGSWFASVSGQRMAYLRVSGSPPNVWRVPGRLATDRTAPPQELIRSSYLDMNSAFSFDGKRIAFQSQRSGRPQIWVSDAHGADPFQLTDVKTQAGTPRWSPDGSKITFDSFDSGNSDIYVVQVDDGSVVRMTAHPAKDSQGTFSRDGLSIYFASNRSGTDQVWKMPARGGEAVQVTRQGGSYALESWDGKHLYYVHESESENLPWTSISIRQVPVGGGDEADVLRVADWTAWDLAPTGIYYSSRHWTPMEAGTAGPRFGESYKILYLNLENGETTEIFREKGQFEHWWLAVSPDEKSILYSRKPVSESDLVLVENFR